MKRAALTLALLAVLGLTGAALFEDELFAAPPESEELVFPARSPAVITADEPTLITFTATLTDLDLNRPKLQVFDPAKGRWKTIKPLKDNGKDEDQLKDDRVFTKRLWFLDSGGVTQIGFEKRNGEIKVKREVPSPAQIRLVAKRKGERVVLVSPELPVGAWSQISSPELGMSFSIPPQFVNTPSDDRTSIVIGTTSDTAVDSERPFILVRRQDNPGNLSVQEFFDGDPGVNLLGQSEGIFSTTTIAGSLAYEFVTLTGSVTVVVSVPTGFLIVTDLGSANQANLLFESILNTMTIL